MPLERQTSFNWMVAMDFFLGGMGAGTFLSGFILQRFNMLASQAKSAELIGPIMVIIGGIFLFFHLGSGFKTKIYLLFIKAKNSWVARGTWINSIFILSAFIYLLYERTTVFGWIAMICSVLAIMYPGFLLSQNKSIPLWNSSVLPPLFLFSGIGTGLAVLLIISFFSVGFTDATFLNDFQKVAWSGVFVILLQLIMICSYFCIRSNKDTAFGKSLNLLKRPISILATIIIGLMLPLLLLALAIVSTKFIGLVVAASVFLIIGAGSMRYYILDAGVYRPRHSL
jgi:formate-dependent nitrite reductase membrane component NrfD